MNVYQSLRSSQLFRVLVLHLGSADEPLVITLNTYVLTDVPPYEALSYHWGTGTGHTITCKGAKLDIKEHLHRALRAPRRADEDSLLWVDALCINQDALDKRSAQVQPMR